MKRKIFYFIGTCFFLAVFSLTLQFVEKGMEEKNTLAVKNMEALAGQTFLCSYSCYPKTNDCCMSCDLCDPIENWDEADVKASQCMREPE